MSEKPKPKHSNKGVPQKRQTNAERARELVSIGGLRPRFVDEYGLSVYTGIAVDTLQKARGKLPKNYPLERMKADMEKGVLVSPPVTIVGGKKMYDLNLVDEWIKLLPVIGWLPKGETVGETPGNI